MIELGEFTLPRYTKACSLLSAGAEVGIALAVRQEAATKAEFRAVESLMFVPVSC